MKGQDRNKILVFSERDDLVPELLSKARVDGGGAEMLLISICTGKDSEKKASDHVAFGADIVLVDSVSKRERPELDPALELLHHIASRQGPSIIIIGATKFGNELASRLAQRLGSACASNCLDFDIHGSNGRVSIQRLYYSGRFIAKQVFKRSPAIITIPPRRFEASEKDQGRKGEIVKIDLAPAEPRIRIIEVRPKEQGDLQIEKAEIIVGVGRGLKKKEDLAIVEELARTLGGAVAGSRPITEDLQWLPSDVQIGLSGKKASPRLYIACGISGQIQHIVGMRDSQVVVAINVDEQAPIMQEADYCLVYDLYKFVPALSMALKEMRRKQQ